ncbi:MAG: hypothetical protein AABW89_05845 [Nanoarchaeota archaeon]
MEIYNLKKYAGQKVYLILNNNFRYTTVLPNEIASEFTFTDKFGKTRTVRTEFIAFVEKCNE